MSFKQIRMIKESATEQEAVDAYGSFVKYFELMRSKVEASKRRGWTNERVALSRCRNSLPQVHEAILSRHGAGALGSAIEAHPFKYNDPLEGQGE